MGNSLEFIIFIFAAPIGLFLGLLYSKALSNPRVAAVELVRVLFTSVILVNLFKKYWIIDTPIELILEIAIFLAGIGILEVIRRRILRAPAKQ